MAAGHANRGTDWVEARDFWLALDPPRSYEAVARRYGVTGARVRFVAKRDKWAAAAADVDARVLASVKTRVVRSRAERVQKVLGIVDGLVDRYDTELAQLELRPADLDRVVKLAELLEGQATDRMDFAEVQEALGMLLRIATKYVPRAQLRGFLDEVRGAMGELSDGGEQAA